MNRISVENNSTITVTIIIAIIIIIIILSPVEVPPNLEQHLRREQQHHRLPRPHRHHVHLHGDASKAGVIIMIRTLISMEEMVKIVNMIEITHRHFVHLHGHWPCTISRSGDGEDNVG